MTASLRVFGGQGGGDALFLLFDGGDDDGTAFPVVARTGPLVADPEAVWTAVYTALTTAGDVTFRLTPIVDGVAYDGVSAPDERLYIYVTGSTGDRVSTEYLLPTTKPLLDTLDPSVELARFFQRGVRFALLLEMVGAAPNADVILDRFEVETEPVTDSLEPASQVAPE